MLNENAKMWVAALRSGRFKQAKRVLHRTNGEDRFCCLGVACILYIEAGNKLKTGVAKDTSKAITYGGKAGTLPKPVREWLGLRTSEGIYNNWFSLTKDNDGGKRFPKIANIIESEPKGLFINKRK